MKEVGIIWVADYIPYPLATSPGFILNNLTFYSTDI